MRFISPKKLSSGPRAGDTSTTSASTPFSSARRLSARLRTPVRAAKRKWHDLCDRLDERYPVRDQQPPSSPEPEDVWPIAVARMHRFRPLMPAINTNAVTDTGRDGITFDNTPARRNEAGHRTFARTPAPVLPSALKSEVKTEDASASSSTCSCPVGPLTDAEQRRLEHRAIMEDLFADAIERQQQQQQRGHWSDEIFDDNDDYDNDSDGYETEPESSYTNSNSRQHPPRDNGCQCRGDVHQQPMDREAIACRWIPYGGNGDVLPNGMPVWYGVVGEREAFAAWFCALYDAGALGGAAERLPYYVREAAGRGGNLGLASVVRPDVRGWAENLRWRRFCADVHGGVWAGGSG